MKTALSFILLVAIAAPAVCDDQQKAKRELDQLTALSNDVTARRIINLSMAEMLHLKRLDLVEERRQMGVNYGSLFLVHFLLTAGTDLSELTNKLRARKPLLQVASEHQVDWSKILNEARRLNKAVDSNLLRHFSGNSRLEKLEKIEDYNVVNDTVPADIQVSEEDVNRAAARFLFLREHSQVSNYQGGTVGGAERNAARADPSSNRGGGGTGTRGGIAAPPAGGLQK